MTALIIAGALVILAGVRFTVDLLARRGQWRVRGYGRLLCFFRRTGGSCLRCLTDFRYATPHDTPYRRDGGLCVFPLCEKCWQELDPAGRLPFYLAVISDWARTGKYAGELATVGQEDLRAITDAVEAGL